MYCLLSNKLVSKYLCNPFVGGWLHVELFDVGSTPDLRLASFLGERRRRRLIFSRQQLFFSGLGGETGRICKG